MRFVFFRRALPTLLLLAAAGALPAWGAQTIRLLGPEGTLAPAPFEVAVVRDEGGKRSAAGAPTLEAEGAEVSAAVREGVLWRFTVTPRRGVRALTLKARDGALTASARYELGPPSERVALTLTPALPVKGRDREATLDIHLRTSSGTADSEAPPPVLRANVGTIEALQRVGPGDFRARYVLPTTRYPEVIVLVAFSAWPSPTSVEGAAGSLVVPLATAIDLPGRTEPGAKMEIEIGGQRFGPVRASADGHFQIPVVVPPGHRFGRGTVVDRIGNRRVEQVDLALPPTDPLACVMTPRTIPLGTGTARVLCATTDPYGAPLDAAAVTLTAQRGHLTGPERVGHGLLEWRYRAPAADVTPDHLEARWRRGGPLAKESLEVRLEQGPVVRLTATPKAPLAFRGGSVPVEVEARDGLGLPRDGVQLETPEREGRFTAWTVLGDGRWRGRFVPAAGGEAQEVELPLRGFGPLGTDPAALRAWLDGGQVRVAVVDLAGLPVPNQPLLVDGNAVTTDARGLATFPATEGEHRISHRRWAGMRKRLWVLEQGRRLFPSSEPVRAAQTTLRLEIAPAVPVNVRIQVQGRQVRYWAEDADGKVLPGRALEVALSAGARTPGTEAAGVKTFEVQGTAARVTVSVADRETGVTAIAEVQP